jgi:predicted Zn-dependent protease
MVFVVLIPLILLITAIWLITHAPKWRRRRELERAGAVYCSHCLRDLSDVDLTRTEFCPRCRRRLPRFAVRRQSV